MSYIVKNGSLDARESIGSRPSPGEPPMSHDLLESAALSLQLDAHAAPYFDDAAFSARS